MNQVTANRQSATGARYIQYCKQVLESEQEVLENDAFHAACAMAVSYEYLDLRDLTPEDLIDQMIAQLKQWSGRTHNTQSAIDRLSGLYGMCANCGELTHKEIGGLKPQPGMRYALGVHVCNGCRLDLEVAPLEMKRAA